MRLASWYELMRLLRGMACLLLTSASLSAQEHPDSRVRETGRRGDFALIWSEMNRAWDHGARTIWTANVGVLDRIVRPKGNLPPPYLGPADSRRPAR